MGLLFRTMAKMLLHPSIEPLFNRVFPIRFDDRLRRLNKRTRGNAALSGAMAAALDLLPPLRPLIFRQLTRGNHSLVDLLEDDDLLDRHLIDNVSGTFHVAGTCRMGSAADEMVVTDSSGRVIGTEALHVVDASIMPTLPRGNTNIPTIMLAEKLSDRLAAA
jgi:5-(hydroxymethyl)furfural/furfural oxidase